jgi:Predicted 3-hydroxylacyl-(acyl carrier protein) dehydratase
MVLLDKVSAYSSTEVVAEVEIRPDHPLAKAQGVPAHVGIELMAQSCGAHVGALAAAEGKPVRVGFLLGTRRYAATTDWFGFGQTLVVTARVTFLDDAMGVYDCRIERDGALVAEAQLNLYQPENGAALLARMKENDG